MRILCYPLRFPFYTSNRLDSETHTAAGCEDGNAQVVGIGGWERTRQGGDEVGERTRGGDCAEGTHTAAGNAHGAGFGRKGRYHSFFQNSPTDSRVRWFLVSSSTSPT